ncbi:hypothetical protein FE697_015710 [Mumia zhuanghuii]|uniref:Uncharacterized protein n=2 Tax=Mumia TaxID=1546255 RepID=A0ABW1QT81_9ACTN|nr:MULTISPECIES: hypothetical protein [Mumia]KAA1420411.1 hypothetical protein FE697_015710 [Mumia zhuanghuii]
MTDDNLTRMLRAADPGAPGLVGDLHGAERYLLEEIVSTPPQDPPPVPVPTPARRPVRRRLSLTLGAAAFAVLVAALVVPSWRDTPPDGSGADDTARDRAPSAETSGPTTIEAPIRYASAVVDAARRNPRLLIGEPGWRATNVYGFAEDEGTVVFKKGKRQLEFNWYAADQYDGYLVDRRDVSAPRPFSIDGQDGSEFQYSSHDIAVMLRPSGNTFAEIRTGIGGWRDRAEIVAVLRTIRAASVEDWLAAMPPEIVTPEKTTQVVDELLTGVPLPPGLAREDLDVPGTNDRYQTSVHILDAVVCGWLGALERAESDDDATARRTATRAIVGARDWPLLKPMDAEGAYADIVRQVADEIDAGGSAVTSREHFGCR